MKKRSKNKVVKALIILTLLVALFYCTLIMPKRIKEASYRLYSFNEIQKLEVSENPLFYEMRLKSAPSEKWSFEILVFAMLNDGIIKDLFSIYTNTISHSNLKLYEDENNVYLCRDGVKLADPHAFVDEEQVNIIRADAAPFIIQYEKRTGKVSDKGLKGNRGKIILDLFSYENNLYYLLEKRIKKRPYHERFLFSSNTWKDSIGFLEGNNPKKFDFKVVGDSLLNVSGCLAGDDYYFPAIGGIYKINLKTSGVELCIEKDYRKYSYVQIIKRGGSFIVIEEKIITDADILFFAHVSAEETEVNILEYSSDFKQEKKQKKIDVRINDVIIGNDGIMLCEMDKTAVKSVYCRFLDFSTIDILEYKTREPVRWHFIDDVNEFWLVRTWEVSGRSIGKTVLSYKE